MTKKRSIISFLVMCVMALSMIFVNGQSAQAAQVSSITSGDEYVIVSNGYALTASGNSLTGTRYTDGQTEITDSMKWTVTRTGDRYTIRSVLNDRYVRYNDRSVSLSNSSYSWNYDGNGFHRTEKGWFRDTNYYLTYQTSYYNDYWTTSENRSNILYTASSEPEDPAAYYPFSVNLFRYDTNTINAQNRNGIQFNTGDGTGINKWTGYGGGPLEGIVSDSLDQDGNLVFNNNYDRVGILDADTQVSGKETFTNVQLQFKYENGYYTFDSDDYDVYFANGQPANGATLVANENQRNMRYDHEITVWNENTGKSQVAGSGTGFYPFDGPGDTTPTYHFGMTFSTEFFMTENGRIGGTEDGEPIKFEFSGDDDVWVFVDGRLVLDLGGIHDKVSGEIDFAEGTSQVYYTNVTNGRETRESSQNIWEMLGTTADTWRSSTSPHTLQVFYLERGKGASNCKISFNLPQKNCVEVTKVMGNQTSNQDELDSLNRQIFTFQAYSKETGTENWNAFKGRPYYVYNSNGQFVKGDVTKEHGEFTLRFGQTARFYLDQDLYAGKDADFYVKEVNAQNSEKDWETSINAVKQGASETDDSPVLVIEAMDDEASQTSALTTYTFSCTNTVSAQAYDDLVVLDYGKPVQVDVLANDTLYGTSRTVGGIRVHAEDNAEGFTADQDLALTNGAAKIAENKVEYTPDKFMDSIDRLDYVVGDADSATDTNVATVSMIPATNVYYEDDFKVADSGNATIEYSGTYSQGVKEGNASDKYQSDENRVYGQDPAYAQQNGFSDGSATSMDQGATATFTFKGTGVDIYTKTDTESPLVGAWIYRETADENGEMVWKAVQSVIVDNKYDVEGEGLYQIPTICFDAEQYGTYKVKIQVMSATSDTAKYYLDGIRIYNPVDPEGKDAEEAESAYQLAGEAGPVVTEIREILLGAGALTDESGQANGMVYLDNLEPGEDGTSEISDYEKDGPKHEVYLSEGNAIAFTLKDYTDAQQVYLAAKAPEGTAATLRVTDGTRTKDVTIDSTSEQYFEITPTSRGHVVIENVSAGDTAGLISITKIRTTNMQGKETDEQALNFVVNADTISYTQEFAVMSLNADNAAIEDPDGTGEDVDIDIDIENPHPDETPEPSQDRPVLNLIQSIVSGFKDLFSGLW